MNLEKRKEQEIHHQLCVDVLTSLITTKIITKLMWSVLPLVKWICLPLGLKIIPNFLVNKMSRIHLLKGSIRIPKWMHLKKNQSQHSWLQTIVPRKVSCQNYLTCLQNSLLKNHKWYQRRKKQKLINFLTWSRISSMNSSLLKQGSLNRNNK